MKDVLIGLGLTYATLVIYEAQAVFNCIERLRLLRAMQLACHCALLAILATLYMRYGLLLSH